ncbi:hypothetical protein THOM_3037, partial [Trachipleistophora hominis]
VLQQLRYVIFLLTFISIAHVTFDAWYMRVTMKKLKNHSFLFSQPRICTLLDISINMFFCSFKGHIKLFYSIHVLNLCKNKKITNFYPMVKSMDAEEARVQLLEQGFTNELIEEALKNTSSTNLEILLDYIEERLSKMESCDERSVLETKEDRERKKKLEELKKQKELRRQERLHLKKLRDQIKADRIELEQEKKKEREQENVEKSVEVKPIVGPDECIITVLNLENGESFDVIMKKNECVSTLLREIEGKVKLADPEIFCGDDLIEEDKKSLDEHGFHPFVTLIVKNAE